MEGPEDVEGTRTEMDCLKRGRLLSISQLLGGTDCSNFESGHAARGEPLADQGRERAFADGET